MIVTFCPKAQEGIEIAKYPKIIPTKRTDSSDLRNRSLLDSAYSVR
jgi:hypothetical protein